MATAGIRLERLGRYRLIEEIGRGGMASVFKAVDPASKRELALKVLSPVLAQEEQFTKRFEREAQVVMRLSHPNIVPVIDFGQDSGYAYLVMPLLNVGSLADRLAEGPLTPDEGGRLLTQLSQALQFAHDRGVIHRDVKPSNVLMDGHGSALLADFGLARIHDASVSLTGSALLGTPAYMSPEQARGEKVGPASDQYSLGVILYQLCTGNLPFEAETPMAVMLKHINEPVPLAREKSPNVPEVIENVILKATAKLPEQRFGAVSELNAAFQAALAHARDPFANPAPQIELPPSNVVGQSSVVGASSAARPAQRSRLGRLAAAAAVLLLLVLACPAAYGRYNGMLDDASSPAEGSALSTDEMSNSQLTALAGTIAALSTELAGAGNGTQSPEQIQTAVMGTLSAGGDPLAEASQTPGPFVIGDGTPTASATPGPSPTPSASATPGPSPTPSSSPTITQPPSPGPSPTPSKTPSSAPSATATATATPSLTASPTTTTAAIVPTNTPTVDPCSKISVVGRIFNPPAVGVVIYNGNREDIELEWINMNWPVLNLRLRRFDLGSNVIWKEGDFFPPTNATDLSGDRKIDAESSAPLVGIFDVVNSGTYEIMVGFTNGCTLFDSTG